MAEQAHLASFPIPGMHLHEDDTTITYDNEVYVPMTNEERSIYDAPTAPRAGPSSRNELHDPALFAPEVDLSQAPDAPSPSEAATTSKPKRAKSSEPRTAARKESHKNVEKKRRETINHGIEAISALLPTTHSNKSAILEAAAKYIEELRTADATLREAEQTNTERWGQAKFALDITVLDLSNQRDYWRNYANTVLNQKEALVQAARKAGCTVLDAPEEQVHQFQVIMPDGERLSAQNHDLVGANRFAEFSKRSAEDMLGQVEHHNKRRRVEDANNIFQQQQ